MIEQTRGFQGRYEEDAYQHFLATEGIIDGSHLVLSGGTHSEVYLNADRVFPDAWRMGKFFSSWKQVFFVPGYERRVQAVVGPATGGVYLVGGFTQFLNAAGIGVQAAWADKDGKEFVLERSRFASVVRGKSVLIVEDVITSGASTMKTIAAVRAAGGTVVGVACMANRTIKVTTETLDVPFFFACWQLDVPSYPADQCPFCAEGRPIVTNIGHGGEYALEHPDYIGGYTELIFDD